ncbi:MAG: hypothetical protein CME34_22980 [Gordonia sp.]|uniref:hypothetical protein n=1 Tax=Gordonia sp. (in: high G+C Gram-positive bacteria) TaxID=84139 RepID=UPI000C4D2FF3|nr:hypothetical protein [Gordonia sp. (in: high G+C Gram-positive bacteria)]MAU84674.1 hypothetical protein [Gordonia sp. (in: high G+C Gram-positive bacteria)]
MNEDRHGNADYERELHDWAYRYDGYRRLAASPNQLFKVLEPVRLPYETDGEIPDWAGVDLLRGWAFYVVRAHRFSGWGELREEYPEIDAIADAVRLHPDAAASDLPPQLPRGKA